MLRKYMLGSLFGAAMLLPCGAFAETAPGAILHGDAKGLFVTAYSSVSPKKSVSIVEIGGRKALKMDLRYEWKGGPLDWIRYGKPGYGQRSQYYEKEAKRMLPNKDYWYTVNVYIPPEMEQVKTYLQMFDLKYEIDNNGTVPAIQFILYPEGVSFETSIDGRWVCGTYRNAEGGKTPVCNRTTKEGYFGSQAAMAGRWLEMVGHFRWAKEDGIVNIWFDGKPVYAMTGDTLKNGKNVQFKFGPYRIDMKGDPGPVTLYYAHVARAGSCAGLEIEGCDGIYAKSPSAGLQNLAGIMVNRFNELDKMKEEGRSVEVYKDPSAPAAIPAKYKVETEQSFDDHPGDSSEVLVGLRSKVHDRDQAYMLGFSFQGTYYTGGKTFFTVNLIVEDPVGPEKPKGLAACGATTEVWDDKLHHLSIPFIASKKNFVAQNADCILAALPKGVATKAAFLMDHFSDIAAGIVNSDSVEMLTNHNLREFMGEVALGRVTFSR